MPLKRSSFALLLSAALPVAAAAPPADGPADTRLPDMAARTGSQTLQVRGFRASDVGEHPQRGITPAHVQAVLDAYFARIAQGADVAVLDFAQLQGAADAVTAAYRKAGFLVSVAYLPPQKLDAEGRIEVRVLEGRIGKVVVQGNQRYRSHTLSNVAERLRGQPLRQADIDSALLYARDLPGVSVSSVLQPGENVGETDLVLVARESGRPYEISTSVDNHGTALTGRGRAQLGVTWNSPLGLGDVFAASGTYAFDPQASRAGALSYSVPLQAVQGLSVLAGANRSELEVDDGILRGFKLKGPASQAYAGADWKFINQPDLQVTSSARYIRESSRFEALGLVLSKQKYDVAEVGASVRHNDARWHGINLAQLSVRQSLRDRSADFDAINPTRDSRFNVVRLGLLRLQYLSRSQRLLFKFNGQYSNNSLPALEQFQVGGNDSVRGYAQGETLGDRGWYGALEYHVDAPGFGDVASPFRGVPWREVLELDVFADQARVFDVDGLEAPADLASVGMGATFRLRQWKNLELRVAAAKPTSALRPGDGRDVRVYARLGLTF
ncbi:MULTISPECIES: ShlB/FhaC/HecB family hemolysin secretion/activation protein [Stenotrophomonas maltophilia group]|uniref:ShlB/FhaC/HecB family hemolysin secretion/activation protein n=1 Tax=Stenotrophomonas maltophilia group TaxID=995085 RepID=UPI00131115EB